MTTRAQHLQDIIDRLKDRIPAVGDRLYPSRVVTLPTTLLPAICLYGPEEDSGPPEVTGAQPQYQPTHTLAIEVRVAEKDGFDVEAGAIAETVKQLLFADQSWLNRFKRYPTWKVRQFLDRRGQDSFCGEVITLTVTDRRPTEFLPNAPSLSGIRITAQVGEASVTANISRPDSEE